MSKPGSQLQDVFTVFKHLGTFLGCLACSLGGFGHLRIGPIGSRVIGIKNLLPLGGGFAPVHSVVVVIVAVGYVVIVIGGCYVHDVDVFIVITIHLRFIMWMSCCCWWCL